MKATSLFVFLVGLIVSLALLVYLPLQIIGMVSAGKLDALFGGVVLVLVLLVGGVIAFFSVGLPAVEGFAMGFSDANGEKEQVLEEKLRAYRARQRAMLEELDEIRDTLVEIRDILKKGMGE